MTQAFRALEAGAKGLDDHLAFMENTPKRIRVMFGGEAIADSTSVQIMFETKHQPVYYFPMEDVRMDLMVETDRSTT
jgi:uncharacterized protein (DUF427 family)